MSVRILIAHAPGEENRAEELAVPLREAGFDVAHRGTVLVGGSVVGETSQILAGGGPVVLCGTIRALGTKWARQVTNAARSVHGCKVFCVKMEDEADVESVAFEERVAEYWRDPERGVRELVEALHAAYPANEDTARVIGEHAAEARYRQLVFEACDIIDLANLPESDRHIATQKLKLRQLYVPLHVTIESSADTETADELLKALEARRFTRDVPQDDPTKRFPVGHRLGKARRLVVLGDPGAGKTTMLRWLATAYLLRLRQDPDWTHIPAVKTLPEADLLPVVIRCRDLDSECASGALDDVLAHTLRKAELTDVEAVALRGLVRRRLEEGKALLLIDGLDEITDPGLRARFAQQLERIHIAMPEAPIIVTSRIVGYREMGYRIGRGFEHLTVADFTRDEKDDFARRWCELTELPERRAKAIQELIEDIHSSDRIERLTGNPMLLTTLALVKRKVGRLPSGRAELYWEALQVLLHWRREVDDPMNPREAVPQLEYLAYAMCDRGVQQLREDEILDLLDQMRREFDRMHDVRKRSSAEFLRRLESRTGIIVETGQVRYLGRPVSVFEFRHLTFQEYLAGLALVDGVYPGRVTAEPLSQVVQRLAGRTNVSDEDEVYPELGVSENWREAIRLCVANAKYDEVDSVLRSIIIPLSTERVEEVGRPRAVLAALCLSDDLEVSPSTANLVLDALLMNITELDGRVYLATELQLAVAGLESSRWCNIMHEKLCKEYEKRGADRVAIKAVISSTIHTHGILDIEAKWSDILANVTSSDACVLVRGYCEASALLPFAGFPPTESTRTAIKALSHNAVKALSHKLYVAHSALDFLVNVAINFPEVDLDELGLNEDELLHAFRPLWSYAETRVLIINIIGILPLNGASEEVLSELASEYSPVRIAAADALGRLKVVGAVEPLKLCLRDTVVEVRRVALEALCRIRGDRRDSILLSRDLDGVWPFLDLWEPIPTDFLTRAGGRLGMSNAKVRKRLKMLATEFGLTLQFDNEPSAR